MGNSSQSLPREIARDELIAAVECLGLVASDVATLTMHHDHVEVHMFARGDNGGRVLDPECQDQLVKYCVDIPVVDDKEGL